MANFEFRNARIKAITAAIPANIQKVEAVAQKMGLSRDEIDKAIATTGVHNLPRSKYLTTSDLCVSAANNVITDVGWSKDEIHAVIFVTQTPDYVLPKTSSTIQYRLGLRDDIFVLDINDGCSGFIYGIITAFTLCSKNLSKILLLVGDTPSKQVGPNDKSSNLLFGDGGCAIAVEFSDGENALPTFASQGVDGSKYSAIIIPDGGYRNVLTSESLVEKKAEGGILRSQNNVAMNGQEVFLFGINRVPNEIKRFLQENNINCSLIDYLILHQANLMMNRIIAKKIGFPDKKVLTSISEYGNTSSLSIPITIVKNAGQHFEGKSTTVLCSGFGVGLSWGSVLYTFQGDEIFKQMYINE
jgi:3-oxoacyl-[acyl-carrier-protein] synthase-3